MEQTRTLEEIQMKMKQELVDRQAQLMLQLQKLNPLSNGTAATAPSDDSATTSPRACPDLSNIPASPSATNGQLSFANGMHNGSSVDSNSAARAGSCEVIGDSIRRSLSADESLSGNISQGSSHDTWDSSNAFAHERPVLTGSERSTPTTTVLPSVDSSKDLELLSQSIHIPMDAKDSDTETSGGRLASMLSQKGSSRTNTYIDNGTTCNTSITADSATSEPVTTVAGDVTAAANIIQTNGTAATGRDDAAANGCEEKDLIDLSSLNLEPDDSTPRNAVTVRLVHLNHVLAHNFFSVCFCFLVFREWLDTV